VERVCLTPAQRLVIETRPDAAKIPLGGRADERSVLI
jgi:hypothetical protein